MLTDQKNSNTDAPQGAPAHTVGERKYYPVPRVRAGQKDFHLRVSLPKGNTHIEVLNLEQFYYWLQLAERGDRCTYWLGHLSAAREGAFSERMGAEKAWRYVTLAEALGNAVWSAYKGGLVTLIQRRHDLFGFEYIAVKR